MRKTLRTSNRTFVLCAALLLSACASTPRPADSIPPLVGIPVYPAESIDFLAVSDLMREFVAEFAAPELPSSKRAWNLSYTMLDSVLVPFDYDSTQTLSAAETFRRRTGNCLSFSAMAIAMARDAGLTAWFQEVQVPPQWTNIDETYLVSMHVNAVIEGRGSHYVVDVSGTRRTEWVEAKKISDTEAIAQFYNNLAAEALVQHNLSEAYAYLLKALERQPGASYVWSNLGVVLNRNGQVEDAKSAYQTALSYNPQEQTALNNLHQLYFEQGDFARAEQMEARVEKYRKKNPWYMYQLSAEAVDEQRYGEAVDLLEDAIKINGKEYRFHIALARAWLLNGDNQAAQQSLERARRLAPPDSGVGRTGLNQLLLNVDS